MAPEAEVDKMEGVMLLAEIFIEMLNSLVEVLAAQRKHQLYVLLEGSKLCSGLLIVFHCIIYGIITQYSQLCNKIE